MDEDDIEAGEQEENRYDHLKPWQFQPGVSGNPSGRPKGSVSLKEFARKYIQELNDEEKLEFMRGLDKEFIWKMADGNPHTTSDNKHEVTMPQPILASLPTNNDETKSIREGK